MISVTEKAADHIKSQLQQRGKGIGIRLGVKQLDVQVWPT